MALWGVYGLVRVRCGAQAKKVQGEVRRAWWAAGVVRQPRRAKATNQAQGPEYSGQSQPSRSVRTRE